MSSSEGAERRTRTVAVAPSATSASSSSAPSSARGSMFSALRIRNYRLFWTGQLVSVTGTFMQGTAQQWLVLRLTHDPLALGVVGALQFGPMLFLGLFGGAIADRWPRRAVLVVTQSTAGALALALWLLTITGMVQIWHVFALALILGIVNAVDMPTRQSFVSELVPSERLINAVSLNSAQFNVARIAGPGLAGLLIALFDVPFLFLLNALSFLAVIVSLLMMRSSELVTAPHAPKTHGIARLRALGDGIRFIRSSRTLAITFLMVGIVGTFGFNFNVLLPLEARETLHADAIAFGLVSSSLGVGALIGALLLARRSGEPPNRLLVGTALTFGVFEIAVAFFTSQWIVMALIAGTGFAMSSFSASANTRTQLSSPPVLRGRVMSVYTTLFVGTTPIGNLLVSAVAAYWGVPMAWIISGVPCLLAALAAAWLWRRTPAAQIVPGGEAVPAVPDPITGVRGLPSSAEVAAETVTERPAELVD
jgi:MFS family permease